MESTKEMKMNDLEPKVQQEDFETFQVTLEDALYELVKIQSGRRMPSEWLRERILAGQVFIGRKACKLPTTLVYPDSRVWFTFNLQGDKLTVMDEHTKAAMISAVEV
jgi:hypothetical protein